MVGPEGLAGEPGKPGLPGLPGIGKPGLPVSGFLMLRALEEKETDIYVLDGVISMIILMSLHSSHGWSHFDRKVLAFISAGQDLAGLFRCSIHCP